VQKKIDRESCKLYYFPYYCVPVRYRTKVTIDSSAAPINIPKTPKYICLVLNDMIFDIFVIYQGFHKKCAQIEKNQGLFKDFLSLSKLRTFQGLSTKFNDFLSPVHVSQLCLSLSSRLQAIL